VQHSPVGGLVADPISALSLGLALMFGTAGLPHILMRFFTVSDAQAARKSVLYATGFIGYFYILTFIIGFGAITYLMNNPVFYTAASETTYTGRYVTDVTADIGIDFIKNRPRNKPFFLMLHNKAPHRPWEPTDAHRAAFADKWIPEPTTLNDRYETRTDALHENEQRVAKDLTHRDLKIPPPVPFQAAFSHGPCRASQRAA